MILLTGGAGYIGSHTCIELIQSGYDVVVMDNLSNSTVVSLARVESIVGSKIPFFKGDIRFDSDLRAVFTKYSITAVIHFAGFKSVGESVIEPLKYYDNNFLGTLALCKVMSEHNCKKIIFSSSATVYGAPSSVPIQEHSPLSATNPYGRSKLMAEDMFRDLYVSDKSWSIGLLRYFNPVGAHESGMIGEDPGGVPNNLMPYISQVAVGSLEKLKVFGGDYPTKDGTGVRDYIHVVDLAKGHVRALEKIGVNQQLFTVNLGTGSGCSVLDMIQAFEAVSSKKINYEVVSRRAGDIAECYSDPSYAKELLGWSAEFGVDRMCEDTWRWQSKNPKGYDT